MWCTFWFAPGTPRLASISSELHSPACGQHCSVPWLISWYGCFQVIDEAHHSTASSYLSVLTNLDFLPLSALSPAARKRLAATQKTDASSTASSTDAEAESPALAGEAEAEAARVASGAAASSSGAASDGEESGVTAPKKRGRKSNASVSSGSSSGRSKWILGVTATAYRADKDDLSDVFQALTYQVYASDLIAAGHLCEVGVT